MPVSITANTPARYAQASLTRQNEEVTKSTLRMSAGQRVLSAADDAAAMAIGTSLRIENSGLKSAIQNATSATSMLQIADGALGQISELITRLQTLAVQSSSGQYDDATRVLLDGEFQGLKAEVERLASATKFNEVAILAGTKAFELTTTPDMAANGVAGVRLDTTMVTSDRSVRYTYDAASERLTLTRVDGGAAVSQTVDLTPLLDGALGVAVDLSGNQKLEVGFSLLGMTLTLDSNFKRDVNINNSVTVNGGGVATLATPTYAGATTGFNLPALEHLAGLAGTGYNATNGMLTLPMAADNGAGTLVLGASAGISYSVGGIATASGAPSGDLVAAAAGLDPLDPTDLLEVEVYADVEGGGRMLLGTVSLSGAAVTGTGAGSLVLDVTGGAVSVTETEEVAATHLTYKVGTGVLTGQDTIGVDVPAMTLKALGLETLSVTNVLNADDAITKLANALGVLNQGRATVGAQQLRLEAVGRNLGVIGDNNEAARSSLIDVDVSAEITLLTTNQSMMQASIAMLTRANQTPDMLLELLRN